MYVMNIPMYVSHISNSYVTIAEKLDLLLKTTAAYSPWSAGIVERHNVILTKSLRRLKKKNAISWEIATRWAVNGKNYLINVHGISPYQLVYSRNPKLPSNIINNPSARENKTICEVMKRHLISLQKVRKAYFTAELSENK